MSSNPQRQSRPNNGQSFNEKILSVEIIPPYSEEAEKAALGAMMINPDSFHTIAQIVKADDFFLLRHRYIWDAITRIALREESIDYLTVTEQLRVDNRLQDIGGPAYLTQLSNAAPDSTHGKTYAQLVAWSAGRRRLMAVSDEIKALAMDEQVPYTDIMVTSQAKLDSIMPDEKVQLTVGSDSIQIYKDMQFATMEKIENGEIVSFPLPSEMGALCALVPTFSPGDFIVISGDSGSGKSCTLEQMGESFAAQGIPSKYIHTEMSKEQILHRRMARHSGLPFEMLKTAGYTPTQKGYTPAQVAKLDAAEAHIATFASRLTYEWMPDVEWEKLQLQLRRDAAAGVKVFLIDHFQDITVNNNGREDNAVRAYEKACIWLAAFAEKRQVVLIVASQENKQGKTKWTSKLKEKAVTLISIRRTELHSEYAYSLDGVEVRAFPGEKHPIADYVISKARFGKTGVAKLLNHGPQFKWVDVSRIRHRSFHPLINGRNDLD